jgi:hypothetical protein
MVPCPAWLFVVLAGEEPKTFTYDNVYDDDSLQKDVYDETAFPLVNSVMEGYNGQRRERYLDAASAGTIHSTHRHAASTFSACLLQVPSSHTARLVAANVGQLVLS